MCVFSDGPYKIKFRYFYDEQHEFNPESTPRYVDIFHSRAFELKQDHLDREYVKKEIDGRFYYWKIL